MMRVRLTIVNVGVGVGVCSLRYTACRTHAPYCRPLWLYRIFPHSLLSGMVFGKRLLNIKCIFYFLCNFVRNISHSRNYRARYYHKYTSVFMWSVRYSCQIWMKLEYSRQVFEKYVNIKFYENSSSESLGFSMRTGGQTYMTKLIVVAYRNFANAPEKLMLGFTLR